MHPMRFRGAGKVWLAGLLVLFCLIAAAVLQSLTRPAQTAAQSPSQPQINAVYLPDPVHPTIDIGRARAFGIRLVSSVADLKTSAPSAAAIIIDRSAFDQLSQDWLAAQLQEGRIIVGLNVPSARLTQIPGYRSPKHPYTFRQDWGGRPFYSLVYQQHDPDGSLHVGASSDVINTPEGFFARLSVKIQQNPSR